LVITSLFIGGIIGYILREQLLSSHNISVETSSNLHIEESKNQPIYTCSMHPQIRQNEEGICPICEMDLIPLEANTSNDPLVLEMTEAAV